MASISECRAAVGRLADQLAENADARGTIDLDRSLSLEITDLGTGFHGSLKGGRLLDITEGADPNAKVKISTRSDDLIALVDGSLTFAKAWTSGQVSVQASMFDLIKLRRLL